MLFERKRYLSDVLKSFLSGRSDLDSRKRNGLLTALMAISLVMSSPAEAKRQATTHHGKAHATASHSSSSHSRSHSASRHSARAGSSSAHVARGHGSKHSIIATSHKRGRHGKVVSVSNHLVHHAAPVSYPEPHAENVQNANSLASVYHLYDRGVNERLMGHYEQATKTLREASNAYTSTRSGLTLEAMIDYELGQAAEASNNYQVAADAYARALRIKPNLIEAAVRLTSMLMKAGQPQAALSRARESVSMNPNDPRAHQILALVLDNNGLNADAKIERDSAERLLRSRSSVNYADVPLDQNVEPLRQTTTSPDKQNPVGDANNDGNAGNSNASSESTNSIVNSANESELRRARQEEQWRIYQQMHAQQSGQTQQQNNQRYFTEKRPFHSTGEFYRARVEPANKSSNTVIEKGEPSDFPNGSSESVKTYTPMPPKSTTGDKSKASTDGAKKPVSDGNGTRSSTPTDPIDNDVMP